MTSDSQNDSANEQDPSTWSISNWESENEKADQRAKSEFPVLKQRLQQLSDLGLDILRRYQQNVGLLAEDLRDLDDVLDRTLGCRNDRTWPSHEDKDWIFETIREILRNLQRVCHLIPDKEKLDLSSELFTRDIVGIDHILNTKDNFNPWDDYGISGERSFREENWHRPFSGSLSEKADLIDWLIEPGSAINSLCVDATGSATDDESTTERDCPQTHCEEFSSRESGTESTKEKQTSSGKTGVITEENRKAVKDYILQYRKSHDSDDPTRDGICLATKLGKGKVSYILKELCRDGFWKARNVKHQ